MRCHAFTAMSKRQPRRLVNGEGPGPFSFYAGVTRATVMVRSVSVEDVEETLLALMS
jgi:hypothetical protein